MPFNKGLAPQAPSHDGAPPTPDLQLRAHVNALNAAVD